MSEVAIPLRAYVLKKSSNTEELTSVEQLKSNQFINLLATCNISPESSSSLPEERRLAEFRVIFIDVASFDGEKAIPDYVLKLAVKHNVALFNCQNGPLCEKLALLAGIQGVFYDNDRADIVLKGIEKLLNNERWFKRETMNLAIGELLNHPQLTQQQETIALNDKFVFPSLTKREKTIIQLVSSGAQNKEIAHQLHISPNTVKTHIYSIFRKTSSRNRIELMSWTKQFQQLN